MRNRQCSILGLTPSHSLVVAAWNPIEKHYGDWPNSEERVLQSITDAPVGLKQDSHFPEFCCLYTLMINVDRKP